jgi:hypothetical protein
MYRRVTGWSPALQPETVLLSFKIALSMGKTLQENVLDSGHKIGNYTVTTQVVHHIPYRCLCEARESQAKKRWFFWGNTPFIQCAMPRTT